MTTLLTVSDVAEWLNVSDKTVRKWTRQGKLIAFTKLPDGELRYDPDELYAWMEQHRPGNGGEKLRAVE